MNLLVIGTLAYDDIETETEQHERLLGGSGVYFAHAAGLFGKVRLVGVVGEDFDKAHLSALEKSGVDTSGVEIAQGDTFRWGGRYEPDWNTRHTTFTKLGVFETFEPKVPEDWCSSEFLFLANAAPKVQELGRAQVVKPRFTMVDTMNLWIDLARDELKELLHEVDAIVLNDEEARMLTGERNLIRAAAHVLELGPRYVVLKKGEHGAFLIGTDLHFSLPAYPVEQVVDPTGAGDSFAGGFMGYLRSCGDVTTTALKRAMVYGTVTASFCVEAFSVGGLKALTPADVERRYNELLRIVSL